MGQGCCKIESLPKPKVSISHAQVAGAFPGLQPWTDYAVRYEELQLVTTTSVSSRSRVTEVRAHASGLRYVCRRCPFEEAPLHEEPEVMARHLETLCELDHPHLCKVVECFSDPDSGDYLLVSEQAHQPTLLDYVEEHGLPNGDIDAADCVRQILSALALGHQRGIAHGRLRHDCILVSEAAGVEGSPKDKDKRKSDKQADNPETMLAPQIKICDMGLGYALRDPISLASANYEGVLYMPPEHAWAEANLHGHEDHGGGLEEPFLALEGPAGEQSAEAISESKSEAEKETLLTNNIIPHWSTSKGGAMPAGADKVDVWAVGVLTFNLLSGTLPFEASDEEKLCNHLRAHRPKFTKDPWGEIPPKAYNAVDMMLKLTPNMRPSAVDMLRHPWLRLTRKKVSKARMFNLYRNAIVNLQEGQFKKFVIRIIAEQISSSHPHKQEALEVFRSLDKDRDGLLNFEEFSAVLQKLPNLEQYTDPVMLFEAADRNRSGTLDAHEFMAVTLPPSEAREDKNLWYAFRAFDKNESGSITLDEVSTTLTLLEGAFMAPAQIEELAVCITEELTTLGFGANLLVSMGLHDHDDESTFGKVMDRLSGLMPCGGRRLDFGEFVYLCCTRSRDFKTPAWAKKEAYRCVDLCCDVDMYHQAHRTGGAKWPPLDGAAASTPGSVYSKKGLANDSQKRQASRAKSSHRYTSAGHRASQSPDASARGSARHSSRGSVAHQRKSATHFMPTHHGHHWHHGEHDHHHHHGEHHHHHHHHQHHEEHEHYSPGHSGRDASGRGEGSVRGGKTSSRDPSARAGSSRSPSSRDPSPNKSPSSRGDASVSSSAKQKKKKPRKPSDYDSEAESEKEPEEDESP